MTDEIAISQGVIASQVIGGRILTPFEAEGDGEIRLDSPELVKDADVDALVGIDFRIVQVTYRPGSPRRPGSRLAKETGFTEGGYISAEIATNPDQDLQVVNRRRKGSGLPPLGSIDDLPFTPGELFVFNDGSTGIYRKVTELLNQAGYIELPAGPVKGLSGDSILDTVPAEWAAINIGEIKIGRAHV